MSTYVDIKYLNLMSHRLPRFSKKGDYLWNFRCPFCGDSKKSKSKARGYVYRTKNDLFYKCHNCSKGTNLGNLILEVDESLYKEYLVERYKEGSTQMEEVEMLKTQSSIYQTSSSFRKTSYQNINHSENLDKTTLLLNLWETVYYHRIDLMISIWFISFLLGLMS